MFIDRILYPVTSLGPGKRIAIWVSGCSRHCAGCANPELWNRYEYQKITPVRLAKMIDEVITEEVNGLTISGGEPFEQAEELADLIGMLPSGLNVLVFSGYRYEELLEKEEAGRLLSQTDVLVDGEYLDDLNDNISALRGSSNQKIRYLNKNVQETFEEYLKEGRKIQNFVYDYKTVSVGIHNRGKQL